MSRTGTRTLKISAVVAAIALAMMLSPLILPRSTVNRFLVAFGFIALCWSLSCLLNAAFDLWRQRGKS